MCWVVLCWVYFYGYLINGLFQKLKKLGADLKLLILMRVQVIMHCYKVRQIFILKLIHQPMRVSMAMTLQPIEEVIIFPIK